MADGGSKKENQCSPLVAGQGGGTDYRDCGGDDQGPYRHENRCSTGDWQGSYLRKDDKLSLGKDKPPGRHPDRLAGPRMGLSASKEDRIDNLTRRHGV